MSMQVSAIMLGVEDLSRAKKFYAEGMGCTIDKDTHKFVSFSLDGGSPRLALYEWEAAAQDAGVSSEGSGFRGASFHFDPGSREGVDAMMRKAGIARCSVLEDGEWTIAGVPCCETRGSAALPQYDGSGTRVCRQVDGRSRSVERSGYLYLVGSSRRW